MLRESDIEKLSQDSGKMWGGRTRKVRRLWYPGNTGSRYFRGMSLEDSTLTSWPQLLMKTQPVASSFRTLPGRFHMETLHLRIACQRQDGKQRKGVMCWHPCSLLFSIGRSPHHGHYFWVVSPAHLGSPRFHGSRQSWDSCASDHDGPDGGYGQNQTPPGERWELCNLKVILDHHQGLSGQEAKQMVFSTMWRWNTSKVGLSPLWGSRKRITALLWLSQFYQNQTLAHVSHPVHITAHSQCLPKPFFLSLSSSLLF